MDIIPQKSGVLKLNGEEVSVRIISGAGSELDTSCGIEYSSKTSGLTGFLPFFKSTVVHPEGEESFSVRTDQEEFVFEAESDEEQLSWIKQLIALVSNSTTENRAEFRQKLAQASEKAKLRTKEVMDQRLSGQSLKYSSSPSAAAATTATLTDVAETSSGGGGGAGGGGNNDGHQRRGSMFSSSMMDGSSARETTGKHSVEFDRETVKSSNRIKIGYYRMSSESKVVKYCYVPSSMLQRDSFNFDDAFSALGMNTPNLLFSINQAVDVLDWNMRLPNYRTSLQGQEHPNPPHELNGNLRHFQGVVRENVKRLLRGTATACSQAGAVFRIRFGWFPHLSIDYLAEWCAEAASSVPLLCVGGFRQYDDEIVQTLLENSHNWSPNSSLEDEEELKRVVIIDTEPFFSHEKKPIKEKDASLGYYNTMPHVKATHLLFSDDLSLLEDKLELLVPTGLIIAHGGKITTKYFCQAVQNGNPIFIFKYTGGTADLASEMLSKVDSFLLKRRMDPLARPEQPFKTELPEGYLHNRWLWPFTEDEFESCRMLNILIENFPDRYNPGSILLIDMFNTSEEKLQDQLTKTMSVVFEGVVEMGGQSAESRRLTFAWRLAHLLSYNASRQKLIADVLQVLIIILTLCSTVAACTYTYFRQYPNSTPPLAYAVLVPLNLLIPLAVTILRGFSASLNPLTKFAALKMSAIKVESEIYQYRTKASKEEWVDKERPSGKAFAICNLPPT